MDDALRVLDTLERETERLRALEAGVWLSDGFLADRAGLSLRAVEAALDHLVSRGVVIRGSYSGISQIARLNLLHTA